MEADKIAKRRRQRMIRIAITAAACHAICSTLPEDAPLWPVHRRDGQCLIHIETAVLYPRVG